MEVLMYFVAALIMGAVYLIMIGVSAWLGLTLVDAASEGRRGRTAQQLILVGVDMLLLFLVFYPVAEHLWEWFFLRWVAGEQLDIIRISMLILAIFVVMWKPHILLRIIHGKETDTDEH